MIPTLILAAAVHVLAPYEWTTWWDKNSDWSLICYNSRDDKTDHNDCLIPTDKIELPFDRDLPRPALFEEILGFHFVCDKLVSKSEFDTRITKWRDQGFPHGICDEGKPIS